MPTKKLFFIHLVSELNVCVITHVVALLEPELINAINRVADPLLARNGAESTGVNPAIAAFFRDKVRHVSGFAGKSKIFAERVMTHPIFLESCDALLLPNCADYQLNLAHLMDRGPGSERQYIHRGEAVWIHYQKSRPELQLATMIALVDFTGDNRATCLVPGSHRWLRTEVNNVLAVPPAVARELSPRDMLDDGRL